MINDYRWLRNIYMTYKRISTNPWALTPGLHIELHLVLQFYFSGDHNVTLLQDYIVICVMQTNPALYTVPLLNPSWWHCFIHKVQTISTTISRLWCLKYVLINSSWKPTTRKRDIDCVNLLFRIKIMFFHVMYVTNLLQLSIFLFQTWSIESKCFS